MLLGGDYKNGWEKYEWRAKKQDEPATPHAHPKCSQWNEEIALHQINQLLIVTEQGVGDTLQFMRYADALRQQVAKVSFCAEPKLHALIRTSGIDPSPLTPQQGNQVTTGQWIPLLSVPRLLGVSPRNPITTEPYIKSTDQLNNKWRDILQECSMPTIGINWRGNRNDTSKQSRNIPIHSFRKIVEAYTGNFVCLQRGVQPMEIEQVTLNSKIEQQQLDILRIADSEQPEDLLEYAAIITNCDLVITTASTVAHLAAGIGIPTWVLLPKVPDWRWGLEGDSTFWYPTMRLFRQRSRGDWDDVMERVGEALKEHFEGN